MGVCRLRSASPGGRVRNGCSAYGAREAVHHKLCVGVTKEPPCQTAVLVLRERMWFSQYTSQLGMRSERCSCR